MNWTKAPDKPPEYSDWKITLEHPERCVDCKDCLPTHYNRNDTGCPGLEPATYAIHRVLLGHRLPYFQRDFSSSESQEGHTKIVVPGELSPEAFFYVKEAFELLLEACYSLEVKWISCTDLRIMTAFGYLADRLEFEWGDFSVATEGLLFKIWEKYIDRDERVAGFYHAVKEFRAVGFDAKQVTSLIAKFCVRVGYKSMEPDSCLDREADVPLWVNIAKLLSAPTAVGTLDAGWGDAVTRFLLRKRSEGTRPDYESFRELTNAYVMPDVPRHLVTDFLAMEHDYRQELKEGHPSGQTECRGNGRLTELEKRCILSLTTQNLEVDSLPVQQAINQMSLHPPLISFYVNWTLRKLQRTNKKLRATEDKCRETEDTFRETNETLQQTKVSLQETRNEFRGTKDILRQKSTHILRTEQILRQTRHELQRTKDILQKRDEALYNTKRSLLQKDESLREKEDALQKAREKLRTTYEKATENETRLVQALKKYGHTVTVVGEKRKRTSGSSALAV